MKMKKNISHKASHNKWTGFMHTLLSLLCMIVATTATGGCEEDNPKPEIELPKDMTLPEHMTLNARDSLMMAKIYDVIGPWYLFGWDLHDQRTWSGMEVAFDFDANELRIVAINVPDGDFRGIMPKEIGYLDELRKIVIKGGTLHGPIPESIGRLKKLETLKLGDNELNGEIPSSIGKLANLKNLEIVNCHVSGPIPETIGDLKNLEMLRIQGTDISGEVPKSMGKLRFCRIDLSYNKLSGTCPLEIASNRNGANLAYNNIEDLPLEVWSDDNPMRVPYLVGNRISTKIPKWVTTQKKWAQDSCMIGSQQEGYGYVLE